MLSPDGRGTGLAVQACLVFAPKGESSEQADQNPDNHRKRYGSGRTINAFGGETRRHTTHRTYDERHLRIHNRAPPDFVSLQ